MKWIVGLSVLVCCLACSMLNLASAAEVLQTDQPVAMNAAPNAVWLVGNRDNISKFSQQYAVALPPGFSQAEASKQASSREMRIDRTKVIETVAVSRSSSRLTSNRHLARSGKRHGHTRVHHHHRKSS